MTKSVKGFHFLDNLAELKRSRQQTLYAGAKHPTILQPLRRLLSLCRHLLLGWPGGDARHFWFLSVRSWWCAGIPCPCWLIIVGSAAGSRGGSWGWWGAPGTSWWQSLGSPSRTAWPADPGKMRVKKCAMHFRLFRLYLSSWQWHTTTVMRSKNNNKNPHTHIQNSFKNLTSIFHLFSFYLYVKEPSTKITFCFSFFFISV